MKKIILIIEFTLLLLASIILFGLAGCTTIITPQKPCVIIMKTESGQATSYYECRCNGKLENWYLPTADFNVGDSIYFTKTKK